LNVERSSLGGMGALCFHVGPQLMCCFTITCMHNTISLMPQFMLLIDCRFVGFFIIVYHYKDLFSGVKWFSLKLWINSLSLLI